MRRRSGGRRCPPRAHRGTRPSLANRSAVEFPSPYPRASAAGPIRPARGPSFPRQRGSACAGRGSPGGIGRPSGPSADRRSVSARPARPKSRPEPAMGRSEAGSGCEGHVRRAERAGACSEKVAQSAPPKLSCRLARAPRPLPVRGTTPPRLSDARRRDVHGASAVAPRRPLNDHRLRPPWFHTSPTAGLAPTRRCRGRRRGQTDACGHEQAQPRLSFERNPAQWPGPWASPGKREQR